MDPELQQAIAGMNSDEIEKLASNLEILANELRWSALAELGVIDPMKKRRLKPGHRTGSNN